MSKPRTTDERTNFGQRRDLIRTIGATRDRLDGKAASIALLAAAFATAYLPDLGHGFLKDDFNWIASSRVTSPRELAALFLEDVGFYRPLVAASFSLDFTVWRLNPIGYALTNLALFAIAAALLFRLARTLSLGAAAALVALAVWMFNFHSVRMSLLWISGRTAILLCVFALACAVAVIRRRHLLGGILCLLALLSKEEAVVLPALMTAFLWWDRRVRLRHGGQEAERASRVLVACVPLWLALTIYAMLRLQSGAFWVTDAPAFYQPTADLARVARNIREYADRTAAVAAVVAALLIVAVRPKLPVWRDAWRPAVLGCMWLPAFLAITIFLPVRSDLYALAPSIGAALVVGTIANQAERRHAAGFARVAAGLLVLVTLLVPVYRLRNQRWVKPADVSSLVMNAVRAGTADVSSGHVVLAVSPDDLSTLLDAFGDDAFAHAVGLFKGPSWTAEIRETKGPLCSPVRVPDGTARVVVLALVDGRVVRCAL